MQKWEGGGQGGGAAGRRIRWRVPELTPNTPGPAASADSPRTVTVPAQYTDTVCHQSAPLGRIGID